LTGGMSITTSAVPGIRSWVSMLTGPLVPI
jgi:hypothetical protein